MDTSDTGRGAQDEMTTVDEKTYPTTAREALARARSTVDPALRAAVATLPDSMRHITGYHLGWCDANGNLVHTSPGKAIRPALTLLCAEALGGASGAAVPAAVSVELVHNFSLLHDDVMDGDLTRRHRPTAWSMFGRSSAILAGDALLSLSGDVLAASEHSCAPDGVRVLNDAVLRLIDGQCADMDFEQRTDVSVPECLYMASNKTGALLGCAGALGALFGGGDPSQVQNLRLFGEHLGLAFQHIDDLLGIWGDPAVTGKAVHADLHTRKKSLPVVAALTSGTPAGDELGALYFGESPLTTADVIRAAELVDTAGGRDWSLAQADESLGQALRHLETTATNARATAELIALTGMLAQRAS